MAEERQIFRAIANFSSVIKSSKQAEEALGDVGDAGEDSSRRVQRSMANMAKDAKKQGQQAGQNLTAPIRDQVDDLQKRLKTKRLEVEVATQKAQAQVAKLEKDIANTEATLRVDADDKAAQERLTRLRGDLNNLRGQVKVDTGAARGEVATLRAELAAKKIEMQVQADADAASLAATEASLNTVARDRTAKVGVDGAAGVGSFLQKSTLSFGNLIALAGTLGTALIPVVAVVGALAAALVAPLAVAGGAATVGGFIMGIAAAQTQDQLKKIDTAKTKLAGLKKGTDEYVEAQKEYRSLLNALTPAQKKYMAAQGNLSASFDRLKMSAGGAIFRPMAQGMNILARILPKLAPLIRAVSGVMVTFLNDIGQFVRSDAFTQFIAGWSDAAGPVLETFGLIAKNTFQGLFGLFKAFAPMGLLVVGAIHRLSIAFRDWGQAAGDPDSGVQAFLRYVTEQGPAVLAFLGALFTSIGHIIGALAPIGAIVLRVATAFLNLFNAIPQDVLTAIVVGVIAAAAAMKAFGIATLFMNGALALSPLTWLALAIGAVVAGLIILYKRSATARKIMNTLWGAIKTGAKAMWNVVKVQFALFMKGIRALGRLAMWLWKNAIGPAIRRAGTIFGWLWKNAVRPAMNAIGGMIRWLWNKVGKPIFNLIRAGLSALGKAFGWLWRIIVRPVFNWIGGKIRAIWNGYIKPVFGAIAKVLRGDLGGAFNDLKGIVGRAFGAIWNIIKGLPGKIVSLGGAMLRAGKSLIGALWDGLKAVGGGALGIAKSIANALIGYINNVIDGINGMLEIDMPGPVPDVNPKNIPHIPKLARGGRATSDSHVIIGDGNEPESVLPDSMLRKLMAQVARIAAAIAAGTGDGGGSKPGAEGPKGAGDTLRKVGKTTKKVWATQIRPALHAWDVLNRKRLIPSIRDTDRRGVTPTLRDVRKNLLGFRKRDLRGFGNDWHRQFTKRSPADFNTFETRVVASMGRVAKRLGSDMGRIRKQFTNLATSMGDTWAKRLRPVFNTFGSYISKNVAPAFRRGVTAVAKAWNKVRDAAARPVRFVLKTVINGGLVKGINRIAKFAGVDPMKPVEVPKFAAGGSPARRKRHQGRIHGAGTGRSDSIPSMLSNNEHVWTEQEVRGAGGHRGVENLRAQARDNARRGRGVAGNDNRMRPQRSDRARKRGFWVGGGAFPLPGGAMTNSHGSNYESSWYAGDFNGPGDDTGMPIVAWKDGRVVEVSQSNSSYGNETVMNHDDGNWTRYAHQLRQLVNAGDMVRRGQKIGLLGDTGNSSGPHLHFEIGGGKADYRGGTGGGMGPVLPAWAQKIMGNTSKWARGLLDGGKGLKSPFGGMIQSALNTMVKPLAGWASDALGSAGSAAGNFGPGAAGVWKSLMSTGWYSPQQAAGVMGNMQSESGFVHNIVQGGGTAALPTGIDSGWGLVQWTPGYKVLPYLNGDGSVGSQIGALTAQLQGKGPAAEAAAGNMLKAQNTVRGAAIAFLHGYERPADQSAAVENQRAGQAAAIFDRFKGTHDRGGPLANNGVAINRSGDEEYVIPPNPYAALRRHEVARLPGIGPVSRVDAAGRGRGGFVVNNTTVIAPRYVWNVNNPIPEKTSATTLKTLTSVAQRGIRR